MNQKTFMLNNLIKKSQIQNLAFDLNADFISLNETFLKNSKLFNLNNYNIIRADRKLNKKKKGGGAALAIKNQIEGKTIYLNEFEEIAGFETKLNNNQKCNLFILL